MHRKIHELTAPQHTQPFDALQGHLVKIDINAA